MTPRKRGRPDAILAATHQKYAAHRQPRRESTVMPIGACTRAGRRPATGDYYRPREMAIIKWFAAAATRRCCMSRRRIHYVAKRVTASAAIAAIENVR